ncbi:phage capsid protein [Lysobacter sp. ESA13C]|uniref:phage capsid protein n=1 Tax=Lysobacter sp. ESA13C TaxID=2862676 RepID=UPI001CBBC99B|nr:phage capsid protein [Lysobacter sp. ESA13C]
MSNQITEAFVQQFGTTFNQVAQQMQSRLRSTVRVESGIVGESKSVNRLGKRSMQRRTTRHGDTPLNEQPHSTRYVDLFDYEDGDMIDSQDKLRLLIDPTSDYLKAMVSAANRAQDLEIITCLGAAARSKTGGNIALPASQKIAVGGTGLTKAKIIQTKKMFRQNEADEENGQELTFVYSAQMMSDVLSDTTLTSADFLAVQMLQEGTLKGKWMGFNWVPSELLPKISTTRYGYAYAKTGVVFGIGQEIVTQVGIDPGKSFNARVYIKESIGAVRVEEEKVVEVACNEP